LRWYAPTLPDAAICDLPVEVADTLDAGRFDVIFTGIESEPARTLEPLYAKHCPVISTASAFRYEDDVPVLIPGVNEAHLGLLDYQRQQRDWQGFIAPNPNCTTIGLAITLAPLAAHFGLDTVVMTSLQAVSGAGRNGGVLSLDIVDNVVPYIPKEEEKVLRETQKILGQCHATGIAPADFRMSATCTRVPVLDGHTESVLAVTKQKAALPEVRAAFEGFGEAFVKLALPSSPQQFIVVHDDPFRPQPRLDRDTDDGMATMVGRLRADTAFENGLQYVLLSHNTKMGAAKGAVLAAELLAHKGYIG
jgi:aspartate-semialdehyde dehydrogenase